MQCPKCQFQNTDDAKFCNKCGHQLERELVCSKCSKVNRSGSIFCKECGNSLLEEKPLQKTPSPVTESERKYVTVLFSDLSGYTAMTEKLDPEEVKDIMSKMFGEIAQVVVKYEGFIEKFIGDAVMALFGVPKSHEDDPIRAIRAAREIHEVVKRISPSIEKKIGRQLYMHTGINTGLVVTRELNLEKGTHGVLGDTINVASRLSSLAKSDEIIIGLETHHQANT